MTGKPVSEPVKESVKENSSAAAAAVANSLTGNPEKGKPGDGWTAYAKAISGIPGAESVQPVKPAPVYPVKPVETPGTKSPPAPTTPPTEEAVRLAGMFSSFLGKAPSPADIRKFDGLLKDNPDLGDLLGFALTPGSRWAEKIRSADHPFAYLESVLEHIRESRERYEQKKAQRPSRAAVVSHSYNRVEDEEPVERESMVPGVWYHDESGSVCQVDPNFSGIVYDTICSREFIPVYDLSGLEEDNDGTGA